MCNPQSASGSDQSFEKLASAAMLMASKCHCKIKRRHASAVVRQQTCGSIGSLQRAWHQFYR